MALLLAPASRALGAESPRHAVLHYLSASPLTTQDARPLVAYVAPDGRALDWMLDGMIVFDLRLHHRTVGGITYARAADIATYRDARGYEMIWIPYFEALVSEQPASRTSSTRPRRDARSASFMASSIPRSPMR